MEHGLYLAVRFRAHWWGGVGWGGVGWSCVNVHVNWLGKWTRLCVCRYVRVDMGGVGWGGVGHVLTFM